MKNLVVAVSANGSHHAGVVSQLALAVNEATSKIEAKPNQEITEVHYLSDSAALTAQHVSYSLSAFIHYKIESENFS